MQPIYPQQAQTVYAQGAFDAGARFDGVSQPRIPVSIGYRSYITIIKELSGNERRRRLQGNKTFIMLNSAKHEVYHAHKC